MNLRDALQRVHFVRCLSWKELVSSLHMAHSIRELDMLIIDSITPVLRYEENRHKILRTIVNLVAQISQACKCIVVNQTTTGEGRTLVPFMHRAYKEIIESYGVTYL